MAKGKPQAESFGIALTRVDLLGTYLNDSVRPEDVNKVSFSIHVEHKMSAKDEHVHVIVRAVITEPVENGTAYGGVTTACTFKVEELSKFLNKKTGKYDLPENLFLTLNSISLSTTRGIMFSEFRGTSLQAAIMPIVNPKGFQELPQT